MFVIDDILNIVCNRTLHYHLIPRNDMNAEFALEKSSAFALIALDWRDFIIFSFEV
jgi:hypothetical protein